LGKRRPREELSFGDRKAIIRTPQGMATYRDIEHDLQSYLESEGAGPSRPVPSLQARSDAGERARKKLKNVVGDTESGSRSQARSVTMPITH